MSDDWDTKSLEAEVRAHQRAKASGANPYCPDCGGRGYIEERHGMEGPWRETLKCECVVYPETWREEEDDDE